jgi:HEAT repeat protein
VHAAWALGELRDPRAVEPLIAALKVGTLQAYAAEALGKIGDARAAGPLIEMVRAELDGPWFIEDSDAGKALLRMGPPAVGPLMEALKDRRTRQQAWLILQEMGDPAVRDAAARAVREIEARKH